MSNLETLPLEDWFETSLSQSWDGATWTLNVNATPNFTFPSGVTTYIVVNPTNSNIQIAEINAYSSWAKTLTVNNITLEKWASVNSTAQSHAVNSKVIISDNYQFWNDIRTAINSKVNADDGLGVIYADATARDAAITSPTNWMQVYVTALGLFTDYISGAWTNRATWSTVNATETVAGKIELPTDAQVTAKTALWETWATICPTNAQIGKSVGLKVVDASIAETDHIVFDKAWTDNKMLISVLREQLASDETVKGFSERATDAEAAAFVDTTRFINSFQLGANLPVFPSQDTTYFTSTWNDDTTSTSFVTLKTYTAVTSGIYRVGYQLNETTSGWWGADAQIEIDGLIYWPLSAWAWSSEAFLWVVFVAAWDAINFQALRRTTSNARLSNTTIKWT